MSDKLKILFFTDSHLNLAKLDPTRMANRLTGILISSIIEYKPDVLLCGGDFFDRPTSFTSKAGVSILDIMSLIVYTCNKRGIKLRILKGTGTHDGSQNDNWIPLVNRYPNLDFMLYKTVDVFSDLGMNILTIPDSTIPNHHKCEVAVRTKMSELGLDTVDVAFTHGMFTHHLKDAGYVVEAHCSDYYSSIVDIVCLNGHIHIPSLYDIFLTGGSTDRFRQGENHPKGIHLVTIDKSKGKFESIFIEQLDAAIFNSYDIVGDCPIEVIDSISPKLDKLVHDDIHIRLHHGPNSPMRAISKALEEKYPNMAFDCVLNDKYAEDTRMRRELILKSSIPGGLTIDNSPSLIADKMSRMGRTFTPKHMEILERLNDECR